MDMDEGNRRKPKEIHRIRKEAQMETKFENLSFPLKVGIVAGWIYLIFAAMSFCLGFLSGFTGA